MMYIEIENKKLKKIKIEIKTVLKFIKILFKYNF